MNRIPARHLIIQDRDKSRPGRRALLALAGTIGLAALLLSLAWINGFSIGGWPRSDHVVAKVPVDVAVIPPNLLRLVPPETAVQVNAARPFSTRPDHPAASFRPGRVEEADLSRAIECLAQAIYYEAGGEGVDGERAVAQVVLNRVRHPGFPPSICGTVYQGAERATGCQFTFTCDGSLRRLPAGSLWSRARQFAREALVSGSVFGPVGHATHYHADYVLPYWADSLEKETRIGRHIFYRLPGILGTAPAFSQRYSRNEPAPPSASAAAVAAEAMEGLIDSQVVASGALGAIVGPTTPESRLPPASPLIADEMGGSLIMPYAPPVASSSAAKALDCAPSAAQRQIKPTAANDLRSKLNAGAC